MTATKEKKSGAALSRAEGLSVRFDEIVRELAEIAGRPIAAAEAEIVVELLSSQMSDVGMTFAKASETMFAQLLATDSDERLRLLETVETLHEDLATSAMVLVQVAGLQGFRPPPDSGAAGNAAGLTHHREDG